MRIDFIRANNFKSLVDFKFKLAKFNCLIGLNGAGKSTVLQFIDFLAQQVRGDIEEWLEERSWRKNEIKSKLSRRQNIEFYVNLIDDNGGFCASWEASYNPSLLRCTNEMIKTPRAHLEVKDGQIRIAEVNQENETYTNILNEKVSFSYEGSILSQLKVSTLTSTPSLIEFRNYLAGIKSLDLLSPEYLRQRTRASAGSLGLGGQRLSAFLHEMDNQKRHVLIETLRKAYPHIQEVHAKSLRSGWKQIEITESYEGEETGFFPLMTTEARHVNDGMLRLIAILAELQSDHKFLLFDEIENGINPELIEFVLDELVNAKKQIIVTTHSPMILNYLDDEVARDGVLYLYKTRQGHTHSVPFFSIPSLAEKLTVMGPGEVFVDTNLNDLGEEIKEMAGGQ